jgi:2-iminobutanoate/2-iminopropanoate deaminase
MSEIRTINPSDHFPFSHATIHNGLVYVSGQVGFKPGTTEMVSDDIRDQCRQTFKNIDDVLQAAGTSKLRIIRCGVYLKHIEQDFASFNECYGEWLGDHRPARSAIQASFALPPILVEVDCIAAVD